MLICEQIDAATTTAGSGSRFCLRCLWGPWEGCGQGFFLCEQGPSFMTVWSYLANRSSGAGLIGLRFLEKHDSK